MIAGAVLQAIPPLALRIDPCLQGSGAHQAARQPRQLVRADMFGHQENLRRLPPFSPCLRLRMLA